MHPVIHSQHIAKIKHLLYVCFCGSLSPFAWSITLTSISFKLIYPNFLWLAALFSLVIFKVYFFGDETQLKFEVAVS